MYMLNNSRENKKNNFKTTGSVIYQRLSKNQKSSGVTVKDIERIKSDRFTIKEN